jgi:hypothetical protein
MVFKALLLEMQFVGLPDDAVKKNIQKKGSGVRSFIPFKTTYAQPLKTSHISLMNLNGAPTIANIEPIYHLKTMDE